MKKLFTLLALLISFGSMAQTFTDKNKVKHTYTKQIISIVTTDDGKVFRDSGISAITATKVKALYDAQISVTPPVVVPPIVTPPTTPTLPIPTLPSGNYVEVVPVNGKALDLTSYSGKNIKIKKGNYSNIYISGNNLNNLVVDGSESTCSGCKIELTGKGNNISLFNLTIQNNSYRPIVFSFGLNNLMLNGIKLLNCGDYAVFASNSGVTYTGNETNLNSGLKIINCTFDNVGQINLGDYQGGLDGNNKDLALFKNIEIAYSTFKNSSPGYFVNAPNAWNYSIHHNTVDNVNASNNNHNGIFFMQGNGDFFNNKLTNYQGNALRSWVYSRGNTPSTNKIYNNICYTTRKYSGFEIQQFSRNLVNGKTTFVNADVYNNTVGKMNTSKDWEGVILDLYSMGGILNYYNNLGFELYKSNGGSIGNMINNMSGVRITESNNKYFANQSDAVENLTNFKSKINGIGAVQ